METVKSIEVARKKTIDVVFVNISRDSDISNIGIHLNGKHTV